jgi:putative FmdB family regulatory protein
MPIYEYQCPNCGVFEVTQRITEHPLKKCPTCKAKVERIISATSFVLKGSGWYATDYAKGSSNKSETSSDSSGSGATGSAASSTASDSKSDSSSAKSESTPAKSETPSKSTAEKPAA